MENDDLVYVGLGYILCWAGGKRDCRLLLTANTIQTVLKRYITCITKKYDDFSIN